MGASSRRNAKCGACAVGDAELIVEGCKSKGNDVAGYGCMGAALTMNHIVSIGDNIGVVTGISMPWRTLS